MYRTLSAPVLVQWEVTPVCNHRCVYCYNFWRVDPPTQSLPDNYNELYTRVVDEIVEAEAFWVVVTGGEPLVVIEEIAPFIHRLTESGIGVSLNSNLSLLTSQKVVVLKQCGIRSILVSLPTANPSTCDFLTGKINSLSGIIAGIKIAIDNGFRVLGNMVISKYNLSEIEQTAELARALKMHGLAVTRGSNPATDSWFSEKVLNRDDFRRMQVEIDHLREKFSFGFYSLEAISLCAYGDAHIEKARRLCTAGKTSCAIGIDGSIRACIRLEKQYGHISEGLVSAWLSMDEYRSDQLIPAICQRCKLKDRCGGGCKADALVSTGSVTNPDPLCDPSNVPYIVPTKIFPTTAEKFVVNSKIKVRVESFGGIVFVSSAQWIPVDERLFSLLYPRATISIQDLCTTLSVGEVDARETASLLVYKRFLSPI